MTALRLIAVGGSLGGPKAFGALVRALPAATPPIVVVLHRGARSTEALPSLLEHQSGRPVREVEDGMLLEPGIYLAPADYHLLVDAERLRLSVDPPVRHARPSIDVLFRSVAESWGRAAAAVLLTAASKDGVDGIGAVATRGGALYVQDPMTAESPLAPRAALAALARIGAKPVVGSPEALGVALSRRIEGYEKEKQQ